MEIKCPCCNNLIAHAAGGIAVMGWQRRWYAMQTILSVTCERCGKSWTPRLRLPSTTLRTPPPGPVEREPDYRNICCSTPECKGRVLAQAADDRALISHRHRFVTVERLLQVSCDKCLRMFEVSQLAPTAPMTIEGQHFAVSGSSVTALR